MLFGAEPLIPTEQEASNDPDFETKAAEIIGVCW
jgi:hypothetical protein